MTDRQLKHFRTLLKSEFTGWVKADVEALVAEIDRLRTLEAARDTTTAQGSVKE